MEVDCIPFAHTNYFSRLILDYLDKKDVLNQFYERFPEKESFSRQVSEKQRHFKPESRALLNQALLTQYKGFSLSPSTANNISLLKAENTFTVVTGHQLNLFTGPLYFLYKIITAIKLATELKTAYPEYNFVPVYWMATEDHDFEEINHFTFKGKKLRWNRNSEGAVGRLSTDGLKAVFETFASEMGGGEKAERLKGLFNEAYLQHPNMAQATRYLANDLFGNHGLVIIDGDDPVLKQRLMPYAKKDILENLAHETVSETIRALESTDANYGIQVNPREINYFYLREGVRERIEARNGSFVVLNSNWSFTREDLVKEMEAHPERFSPNVIARPLYQEVILPNLCYIGGGGEISYWLELRAMFEAFKVPFPILMLRNSALLISEKQGRKLNKLNVSVNDIFLEQNTLINKKVREISNIDIDFTPQREHLKQQFSDLYQLAGQTDKSFLGAVKAQEVKQLKGLDHLEKRLLKAQKHKLKDQVVRLAALQNELFPGQGLQERQQNFSDFYLDLGEDLIPGLIAALQAFPSDFRVLRY